MNLCISKAPVACCFCQLPVDTLNTPVARCFCQLIQKNACWFTFSASCQLLFPEQNLFSTTGIITYNRRFFVPTGIPGNQLAVSTGNRRFYLSVSRNNRQQEYLFSNWQKQQATGVFILKQQATGEFIEQLAVTTGNGRFY